ncbi:MULTISPECIES: FIST signal transduction protein [unclassified Thiocapsa]
MSCAHSLDTDMSVAAASLADQALADLDGHSPQAGLVFSTFGLDHAELLAGLADRLPGCSLLGGSSYGETSRDAGYRLGSSLLILFASDTVAIRSGVVRDLTAEDEAANFLIAARELEAVRNTPDPPCLCLLFPDGMSLDGDAVVRVFGSLLPRTSLFGGATAENFRLNGTCQFFEREILQRSVPYILFSGPLRYSWAVTEGLSAGWRPVSARLDATCDGNRIKTIERETAFGYLSSRYPLDHGYWSLIHPVAVYPDPQSEQHSLRDVIRYDDKCGSLESLQGLPSTCQIQFTQPDPDAILLAARRNLQQALTRYPDLASPAGALWFSSASRALVLKQHPESEYRKATELLTPSLAIAGFYTYGEIAPAGPCCEPAYHNCSLMILLLGEEPRPSKGVFASQEAISEANLLQENKRLTETLKATDARLERTLAALDDCHVLERLDTHCRTEQSLFYRARALDLLCQLLDTRFEDVRRLAFKGSRPRLNRSGLARLIDAQHRRRYEEPFPLSIAHLARLLSPVENTGD